MPAFHVRTSCVVVHDPLANDIVHAPLAEEDELEQALVFDRLNEPLDQSCDSPVLSDIVGAGHDSPVEF